ncbi:hypothetical protein [Paenibacillus contaminans]|uniref:Isochorismatase-like domain-containing protein n=1 Tax=Paenibacillus contaminans TaxID=450362 RepID=A0A329MMF8_9BACL|nr:hypothetical protein [Paenibacillus contaminans]RAV21069.1 hypothetical protein DQG23_13400 [Paenibacillus contaminans]
MKAITVPTWYYRHFGADRSLDVPAEGYGGWNKADLEMDADRTALVVMHAWDCGTWDEYPGWHQAVEYIPRSYDICKRVMPGLLETVRSNKMKVYHVVRPNSEYYKGLSGYLRAQSMTSVREESFDRIEQDPVMARMLRFKSEFSYPGEANKADIIRGQAAIDFPEEVRPVGTEGIAENADQLFALCKEDGVNHLIYTGFAINGCLITSPGGMLDMQKRGLLCSAIRQAVTAIENKETARTEQAKELALWYVALMFGFVYDLDDLLNAISLE